MKTSPPLKQPRGRVSLLDPLADLTPEDRATLEQLEPAAIRLLIASAEGRERLAKEKAESAMQLWHREQETLALYRALLARKGNLEQGVEPGD